MMKKTLNKNIMKKQIIITLLIVTTTCLIGPPRNNRNRQQREAAAAASSQQDLVTLNNDYHSQHSSPTQLPIHQRPIHDEADVDSAAFAAPSSSRLFEQHPSDIEDDDHAARPGPRLVHRETQTSLSMLGDEEWNEVSDDACLLTQAVSFQSKAVSLVVQVSSRIARQFKSNYTGYDKLCQLLQDYKKLTETSERDRTEYFTNALHEVLEARNYTTLSSILSEAKKHNIQFHPLDEQNAQRFINEQITMQRRTLESLQEDQKRFFSKSAGSDE